VIRFNFGSEARLNRLSQPEISQQLLQTKHIGWERLGDELLLGKYNNVSISHFPFFI